jgi:60 kDa SS-A/Ro ribonucleoprotein
MPAKYARHVSTKTTPQTSPVRGKKQVRNDAGGYVFPVDCWTRLHRFLILGHEGGSYYATERQRTLETVACIDEALAEDPRRAIDCVVDVSTAGRAPKNDPAIFALAYIAGTAKESWVRTAALSKLSNVCRIGTHLFDFCTSVQEFRGWGRGLREAVAKWYTDRSPMSLALQVTKYQQRNGWSHRDVLRKAHPQATGLTNEVLEYVTQRESWWDHKGVAHDGDVTQFLIAVEEAKTVKKDRLIKLILDFGLVREHIPTTMLNDVDVWDALLEKMPLTALIRNLGKMTSIGLLKPLAQRVKHVVACLKDAEALRRQRVHPLNVLVAQRQYREGRGDRGKLSWNPVPQITDALEDAFYLGFDAVEPTGKNFLLGVDVSGSMSWGRCAGAPISCCEAAAVMAMLAVRTEPNSYVLGFCHQPVDLKITAKDTLESAANKAQKSNFGGTDCAAAMNYAIQHGLDVDVFCIYTDGQTWAGPRHVFQALQDYRQKSGRMAKLAAFQLEGHNFSIADPSDAGMMDFSGFDTAVPPILADFVLQGET